MNKQTTSKLNSIGKLSKVPYDYVFCVKDFPLAIKSQLQSTSPGWHDHDQFYELVLVVSGKGNHICESKKYPLQPQEILIIEPGMHHSYDTGSLSYYNVLVNFERLQLPLFDLKNTVGFQNLFVLTPQSHYNKNDKPLRHILMTEDFNRALLLIDKMHSQQLGQAAGYQMKMVGYFIEFLQIICSSVEKKSIKNDAWEKHSQTVSSLAMNLAKNCHKDWSVKKMCKDYSMSRSVLFREFKKYYSISPVAFLNNQRLHKVCVMLEESDEDIEYIALKCGFANGSYMATAFKQAYDITPLKYRKQYLTHRRLKTEILN